MAPEPVDDPLDAVFTALGDPTRRAVVRRLLDGGPESATALARDLPITRQAVAKHLRALTEAGLVEPARQGREVRYAVNAGPLTAAAEWIEAAESRWDTHVARLRRSLGES